MAATQSSLKLQPQRSIWLNTNYPSMFHTSLFHSLDTKTKAGGVPTGITGSKAHIEERSELAAPHLPTSQPHMRAGFDPGGFNAGDSLLDFQRGGSEHIYRPVPVLTRQQYKPRMDRGRQGETERAYFHKRPSKQWRSSSRCFCISFLCFLLFLPRSCRIRCRRGGDSF